MKIDKVGLARRLFNFTKKTKNKAKDKTREIMDRFTIDAENERRMIYNAQRDSGKIDYLPSRGAMQEEKRIKDEIKRRKEMKFK